MACLCVMTLAVFSFRKLFLLVYSSTAGRWGRKEITLIAAGIERALTRVYDLMSFLWSVGFVRKCGSFLLSRTWLFWPCLHSGARGRWSAFSLLPPHLLGVGTALFLRSAFLPVYFETCFYLLVEWVMAFCAAFGLLSAELALKYWFYFRVVSCTGYESVAYHGVVLPLIHPSVSFVDVTTS